MKERTAHIIRRKRAHQRFKVCGFAALAIGLSMLLLLLGSLIMNGANAFRQTMVTVSVTLDPAKIDPRKIMESDWRKILGDAFLASLPEVVSTAQQREVRKILSNAAGFMLRDKVAEDLDLIGQTISFKFPVSDPFDQLMIRKLQDNSGNISPAQQKVFASLHEQGRLSRPINWRLLQNADSRFPEIAGLRGALWGTFYVILICFFISFPIGVGAGIYLEEFNRKGRLADFIEINVNNLAAVPSVVFGLLGLGVFINAFGMPRSAPIVGGLTLALIVLPTIIISTRAALKAVPPSIRDAAYALGASKHQVILHHVLPLAFPGLMTGTIIGLAHALGETAPLLLVGMNAFITAAPEGILSASTTLPTQIFLWSDSPERGFIARTSAAILVLLAFLILMNGIAVLLRRKFEKKLS